MLDQEGSLYPIGVGFKTNYMINYSTMVAIFNNNTFSIMWHRRLDHLHNKAIKEMIKSNMVIGLANVIKPTLQGESYILGKQTFTHIFPY
jgi:hypothetical protein